VARSALFDFRRLYAYPVSLHWQFLPFHSVRSHVQPPGATWPEGDQCWQPAGTLHPRAVALLHSKGISTGGCYSKSWNDLPVTPDIVVTVCGSAAGEMCPAYLGPVLRTHWGVDDPGHVVGTGQEIDTAFEYTYYVIRARIEAFLALPLDLLANDKAALKTELDRIGAILA
jgi:arsenate reductase